MPAAPRVAIVAMGGLFPSAATPDQLWDAVLAGSDHSREVPAGRWVLPPEIACDPDGPKPDRVYSKRGCFLDPFAFDASGLDLPPGLLEQLDPVFHLALAAGKQAFDAAVTRPLDRRRVGVILGNIVLPTEKASELARDFLGGGSSNGVHPLNRCAAALPAALLARALGLGGGSFTLDAACASSLYALKLAGDELRAGRLDAVLAGGVSRPDCLYTQMGFSQLRALSPSGRCRPFDAAADGLVVGEGAGVFVLKRLADARRDGDRVLAVIAGCGLSNDVGGGLLAPDSEGQLRAMRAAYREAGWAPHDVDLIECHAAGTPLGDAVEFRSLRRLWGDGGGRRCVIGSVKATVGHLLTSAGAAALCKVLAALRSETLPPTANFQTPGREIDLQTSPFRILRQAEPWDRRAPGAPRRAAVSGFGFGGVNAHLLLEEDQAVRARSVSEGSSARPAPPSLIAIVGLGAHFGPWASLDAFADRVLFGDSVIPRPDPEGGAGPGFFIEEPPLDAARFRIPPREAGAMLPQQRLMLRVADEALREAQLSDEVRLRTGVFVGLGLDLNTTRFHLRWSALAGGEDADAAGPPLSADRTMGGLGSIVASRVARAFRLGGPSFALAAEENSGLRAVDAAARALQRGEIDLALAGAVDLGGAFHALRADAGAPGEGAGAVVLKRLADAQRAGDAVYAVLRGVGFAQGGAVEGAVDPEAERRAQDRACREAGIDAAWVGWAKEDRAFPPALGGVEGRIGHAGAASGLAELIDAALCLRGRVLPARRGEPARHWLRDRADGPRRAGVGCLGLDGNRAHVVLEAPEEPPSEAAALRIRPPATESLFAVHGRDAAELIEGLDDLRGLALAAPEAPIEEHARRWRARHVVGAASRLAVVLVAGDPEGVATLAEQARRHCASAPTRPLPAGAPSPRDRIFYAPDPLGPKGRVAFVFPGSGNNFPDLGRDLALRWPEVLLRQDAENERLASQYLPWMFWSAPPTTRPNTRERLFGQVALTTLVCDLLGLFGVRPAAALGYSLGESAALFALRAWSDRDGMRRALNESPLFARDLSGPCDAARRAWNLPPEAAIEWSAGVVDRPADEVRRACSETERAYLLIVNAPRECVVGGESRAVAAVVRRLGCGFVSLPDAVTVHCPVVRAVADAYRELHRLPTTPPPGVHFYSAALGRAYDLSEDAAAEAILAQALDTLDFPAVVESAYRDGVRLFVEVGPGSSCTRLIGNILEGRPHRARSACAPPSGEASLLRLLALLIAEGVPVNLEPLYGPAPSDLPHPPGADAPGSPALSIPSTIPIEADTLDRAVAVAGARAEAHAAYLRLASASHRSLAGNVALQTALLGAMSRAGAAPSRPPTALDRSQCLEFAVGSIARVLGPDYADIDSLPTRVRLPDEPLMLVDRVLSVEGEPLSLGAGRVVTEHDVRPGAWYLDGGRAPTCIAVEAGQADLFLSGFLGVDRRTRGRAVYRLLDAAVTFHRGLPAAGSVIRYDIHIDGFFRQGDTILFRFRFEGALGGERLLSMAGGCAGFFTAEELAAGRGVVQTELDRRPRPGVRPDEPTLVPMAVESYDVARVEALRRGDLEASFGPAFAGRRLAGGLRLPGGRMRLVDRVTRLDPAGGRFGLGLIRAEADVDPQAWFLACHFIDDRVMPGTLMYECCLHTLRIFLLRMGWIAEDGEVGCEPVVGVASRLKCRGQVTAHTRTVAYEVVVKEWGYRPEPYALADALMYADGKCIVEIADLSLRLRGLSRDALRRTWSSPSAERAPLFDRRRILAFAVGKPSEAFGAPYRVFDSERVIARLPGPPYQFLDRVVRVDAEPWKMVAGAQAVAEYDVPPDAWYFAADRQAAMPFAVLLEVALQPCGWLAAYLGSALTSPVDLSFRNLGGDAELLRPVGPDAGTLATRVKLTDVASSGGMILQHFDFETSDWQGPVYRGRTSFGFFSREALQQQVGLRDLRLHEPGAAEILTARAGDYPSAPPFPDERLRMIDRLTLLTTDGGPAGLGLAQGAKGVRPDDWFFRAHFYQDPVCPGSLGLESLLQLLKALAVELWPDATHFESMTGRRHRWLYRGQVVPSDREATVQAVVTGRDDAARRLTADGLLAVDGRVIYQMKAFTLVAARGPQRELSSNRPAPRLV
jgi:acyl transferase domain-containing protein/3-hydroxymyristoyl/3-hydroxydecanoyl-(acyl carrier protein) dehydratase